ncbi:MAG: type II secretion system protein [bacterium]
MISNLDIIIFRSSFILSMGKIKLSQTKGIRKGFTFVEILLVLIFIGVIGAITISVIYQNIQDAHLRTEWKAVFSDFSQAVRMLTTANGGDLAGVFTSDDIFRDKILAYMNYTKKCNDNSATGTNGCWHDPNHFYKLSGGVYGFDWSSCSRAILNNGTLVAFARYANCTATYSPNHDDCGHINFDVNGDQIKLERTYLELKC